MSKDSTFAKLMAVSETVTRRERIILSVTFMALMAQVEVMKWRNGWEIGYETDLFSYILSMLFYIVVWGTPGETVRSHIRYIAAIFLWNVVLDVSRLAYLYVVGVLLFPVKPEAVIQ